MNEVLGEIYNCRELSPTLATSGQPKEDQLRAIAAAGYEVVINLALHDDPRYSLADEAEVVKTSGMKYVHIPVQFAKPERADLDAFFAAMDEHRGKKVWVHCAANMRVTAFLGLYWSIREGWETTRAFELMDSLWKPNKVWASFIAENMERTA
jgi:protein tyrosine phosphatase (PTP) superfamily phosphohydrolase (DUF442 family)